MTLLQYACGAAAVALAAWPQIVKGVSGKPGYQTAIANLASVRLRLLATNCLEDDQKKAIDVLTLALVDGSDQ